LKGYEAALLSRSFRAFSARFTKIRNSNKKRLEDNDIR